MGIIRKILAGILLIGNLATATLLFGASYTEWISPQWYAYPALLGLAFPIIALINLLFLITWIFVYPRYIWIPFISFLICAPAMWKYCPIHLNNYIEDNHKGFTVLSYNVYYFNDIDKTQDTRYNHTLQYILNADADLALIQEAPFPTTLKWRNITDEQIKQMERQYPYYVVGHNNFILSKYPIEEISDTSYSSSAFTNISRVDISGKKITLFNNHLESIGLNQDDKVLYREITSQPDSIKGNLASIKQMTHKFLNAFKERARQVEFVDSVACNTEGNIIMCGDINDTPNSYAYRILKKKRHDAYLECGNGPGYTYQMNRMWVRIDHVIYEGDFKARYIEIGKQRSSDHYPILVRFDWEQ